MKCPDGGRWYAGSSQDRRVTHNLPILGDVANLVGTALTPLVNLATNTLGNALHVYGQRHLTQRRAGDLVTRHQVLEYHMTVDNLERHRCPRGIMVRPQPVVDLAKFLERDMMLVAQDGNCAQADKVLE